MLALEGVTVAFGGLVAVSDVSFSLAEKEVIGLVGPNGAGKTTLFNAVSGLVRPTKGKLSFAGHNLIGLPIHKRARIGLGRAFQVPQPMHELTVRENLIVAQRFGTGRVDAEKIAEILDITRLGHKADMDAATSLALTEQKALEVGKALATNPRLLMLDEVLAGLETAGKRAFMQTLDEARARFGLALLMVEHDIETISNTCPRVIVLNFGRLIADGTPDDVFRNPEVIRSYTGGEAA
ncbi:ABC transporter ATP-binding protein [Haematobacter massiliensis]|uniref:Branched-chain amino acid ABC transporter ATPase n=1 Tax=Haematobacter massiliensis TaxID=195105 RepID=A0A086Y529_9RHOB|nr:ABC transporter ATP-binding protein [Haematobacter massiliensis]KFI29379.1 branched-chain amino acid ABC transporter ATPase [Haematobacter massiliensis]OWJ71188.1 ABC transporter ATP-binding protein [Haematobacter massiliensis]OWJ84273.1 ABC transporter ATP-binding protein [Haematobacter massiliensis]QBJ25997.1 ABC transporter ATP-binding protein [Haematobacter massiliensis]